MSNINKYAIAILVPEPTMVAKGQSSNYSYIIGLFCFRVTLVLACDYILCNFSKVDFFASSNREVECFEAIYDVIWYLLTNLKYLTFSRGQ